ncbi:WecB/TagA/CpsF family glycosyltransferase [Candidatus Uhrbacteria bacterium]|nr:WecB/TagA/CpsF family glycosyltransferase [Candidatus Uhrbacteria bacterium]
MRTNILGVPVDAVTGQQAVERVRTALLSGNKPFFVVTPNPEFVVRAQKDREFMDVLNQADLSVPDGIGLLWAAKFQGQPLPERVTGADLTVDICRLAAELGKTVYLLGGDPGMAEKSAESLKASFPGLKIVGAERGGRFYSGQDGKWRLDDATRERLHRAKPDILLVGLVFGGQEKWLRQNLSRMPWLGLAMGVGGTFEFLGGKISRAPESMRKMGLEWLWRLFIQPCRWKRIFRATVVFPLLIFKAKFGYNK